MYAKCFKLFAAATLACGFCRVVLKTVFVDTETGFYLGAPLLVYGFAAMEAAAVVAMLFFCLKTKDTETGILKGSRTLELSTAFCGVLIALASVPRMREALSFGFDAPAINRLPTSVMVLENALGIAAGLIIIYIAFCFFSGAANTSVQGLLMLIPVLWQTLYMVERYISFRQVNTVSDQFLETIYLIFATLFLLYSSRYVAHAAKGRRRCIFCALIAAHFGVVTVLGQFSAVLVLGKDISGPPLAAMLIMLGVSFYAVAFSASLASNAARKAA